MPENFRYIPFLVNDTTTDEIKCTSCGICAKVCPPQCIWIERTRDPVTKRPVPQPKEFYIDVDDLHELRLLRRVLPVRRDQDGPTTTSCRTTSASRR